MKSKTYRIYPKAINDLESIYLYSSAEFWIQKTEEYILAIETSLKLLANDPLISRNCDYIRNNLRAFNVGSHIIFFKLTSYGIAIIRILHQSMDFKRQF